MNVDDAIRALSYWRPVYLPTYVGVRALLESSALVADEGRWIEECLGRKSIVRKIGRYHKFSIFKGTDSSGNFEHRTLYAASPTTAIMEAIALRLLSSQNTFSPHSRVFSYLWPNKDTSTRTYAFYADGYRRRNASITSALLSNTDFHVGIFDIKNFYPTIQTEPLKARFMAKLSGLSGLEKRSINLIEAVVETYLAALSSSVGIAVGSPMSHMLASIALEVVDERMFARFGSRYFRYVDDVVVVGSKEDCESAHSILSNTLDQDGFTLHPNKTEIFPGEIWLDHLPPSSHQPSANDGSFEALWLRVALYLSRPLSSAEELSKRFRDQGLSFPISRFSSGSKLGYLWKIRHLLDKPGSGWIRQTLKETISTLTDSAIQVRDSLWRELTAAYDHVTNHQGTVKKWKVQRARYLANRLLYLPPSGSHQKLHEMICDINGLYETQAVALALSSLNAKHILNVPGPAVNAFCSIAKEAQLRDIICEIDNTTNTNGPAGDSIVTLGLYGLLKISDFADSCNSQRARELKSVDFRAGPAYRTMPDFSSSDEFECLALSIKDGDVDRILTSRFNDSEAVELEGLLIGSGQSSY